MKKFTIFSLITIVLLLSFNLSYGQIISQRGTTTSGNTTGTTLTIPKPTGLAVGDVMLVAITQSEEGGSSLSDAIGNSATWTLVRGTQFGVSGSDSRWATVLYRVATAGDVVATNFTFTLDADNEKAVGAISAYFNVDLTGGVGPTGSGSGPFDVGTNATVSTGNSSSISATGITTNTGGAAIIMMAMIGDNNSFSNWSSTSPGSLNQIFEVALGGTGNDVGAGAGFGIKAVAGATGSGTVTQSATDSYAALLIALKPSTPAPPAPSVPNLWASSSDGSIVSSYSVNLGYHFGGPTTLFTPTFPGTTTGATYTSAIGRTDKPTQATGHYYWIGNTAGNSGVVEIWGANSTGGSQTRLGSVDMNGGSTTALGFVRLGMGPDGTGWILAGESGGGSTLYLASFATNLLAAVSPVVVDNNVALVGGAASTFQNGDLCVAADGRLYALANDGSGLTQIFIGVPNGSATTLTKKWDLVDNSNVPFTGSVNGVAFSSTGSLYITTATGLYYIDANTVNGPAGTVQTVLVHSQTGLHDLASNVFPSTILLPVKLISFTGTLNGNTTNLNWVTESIQNFSHFEIERSADGTNFTSIASKNATGDLSSRTTYTHSDNMSSFGANYTFYYRLKMVDLDGKFSYSSIILIRKDGKAVSDIRVIPNPLVKGSIATIRFETTENATVNINVLDMAGRVVLRQQNNIAQGINSIPLNSFNNLQPGTYILQMNDGTNIQTTKFIIAK